MAERSRLLRWLVISTVTLWTLLVTVWLASNTVVAVYRARVSVEKYADEQESRKDANTYVESLVTDTLMTTDTMATDTMATSPPTIGEDLATIRAAEVAAKRHPGSALETLAKIRAEEASRRLAASKKKELPN